MPFIRPSRRPRWSFGLVVSCVALLGAPGSPGAAGIDALSGLPTPDVLAHRAVGTEVTWRTFPAAVPDGDPSLLTLGPDLAVAQGFGNRVEVGFAASGGRHALQLVTGQARVRLLDEREGVPALAVGALDLTGDRHPYGESLPPIAPAGAYAGAAENDAWYAVTGKSLGRRSRFLLGIGGGRFVGREAVNRWAHGAFAGLEAGLGGPVAAAVSFDGRGLNAGLSGAIRTAEPDASGLALDLTLEARHLQNLRTAEWNAGLRPVLAFGLTVALSPGRDAVPEELSASDLAPVAGRRPAAARRRAAAKRRPRVAAAPKVVAPPPPDPNAAELARLKSQLGALRDRLAALTSSGYAALAGDHVKEAGAALDLGDAAVETKNADGARGALADATTALDAARRTVEAETGRPLRW